jgi:hypothetical protein
MTKAFWERHPVLAYYIDILAYGLVVGAGVVTILRAFILMLWS